MNKQYIDKFLSLKKTDKAYENFIFSLSPLERLSITEYLRRQYYLKKNKPVDLSIKKVIKIVKG
jgi:hypothetical protein